MIPGSALEKGMATHPSILAWEIPWTVEPGGLRPCDHKESDTTERLTLSHNKALKAEETIKFQRNPQCCLSWYQPRVCHWNSSSPDTCICPWHHLYPSKLLLAADGNLEKFSSQILLPALIAWLNSSHAEGLTLFIYCGFYFFNLNFLTVYVILNHSWFTLLC